jgi:hypothetical protein
MSNWAEEEMAGAQLPDERFRKNAGFICERLAENSGVSFSVATGHAGRQAASRLFSNEKTSSDGLLYGHVEKTVERCGGHNVLLVPQDTTFLNYTSHVAKEGLGPIQGINQKGLQAHSALATTEAGVPLGILHLDMWARDPKEKGVAARRRKRPVEDKESHKWIEGKQAVQDSLSGHLDNGGHAVVIQDREADVFALFIDPRHPNLHLVVRAAHPRRVEIVGKPAAQVPQKAGAVSEPKKVPPLYLFDAVLNSPVLGTHTVVVPRKGKVAQRAVCLELRAQAVVLRAPNNGKASPLAYSEPLWIVDATEKIAFEQGDPQAGGRVERLSWTLITTLPVSSASEAQKIVEYYTRRWVIERLHLTLKSGIGIERLQFDDVNTLSNALAVCWIAAWRILWLTYQARESPNQPSSTVLEEDEEAVLEYVEGKTIATVKEAITAIAKLGGYRPSPKAAPPGVKALWTGLRKLEGMVEFYGIIKHRIS